MSKRVAAGLLKLSILTAVFLGSCAGSSAVFMHSARWNLDEVDPENDRTFFSAYVAKGNDEVEVVQYRYRPDPSDTERISYRMPRANISYRWKGGGSASIAAEDQADGSQLIRIYAIGDTPWTSLSEYRVVDNEIHPLGHGASNPVFLIGALLSPFLTWLLQKPVGRLVATLVGTKT